MTRTNELSFYADDATKRELDRRAEVEGVSRSNYLNQLVVRHLQQDDADEFAEQVHAEDRIRELIQIATDEMQQATAEMRDLNAKTGAYAAANFELLKSDFTDTARRDALSTGSRRMRQDLDVVAGELDDATQDVTESDTATADDDVDDDRNIFNELRDDQDQ